MPADSLRAQKRKRRRTAGKILVVISLAVLIFGTIYTNGISDRWGRDEIDEQKEIAQEALDKGYTCFEAEPGLQYGGTEGGFDVYIVTMESGERFAIVETDLPDRVYREGIHSPKVDVFVKEDSAEIKNINGFDMTLYQDCYAALDYNPQGAALGGAIAAFAAEAVVVLIFLLLLITGILLIVFNRKEQGE